MHSGHVAAIAVVTASWSKAPAKFSHFTSLTLIRRCEHGGVITTNQGRHGNPSALRPAGEPLNWRTYFFGPSCIFDDCDYRHSGDEECPANTMRLLHVRDFSFRDYQKNPEPYAILSHRWTNSETTFSDIQTGRVGLTSTSSKVSEFARYVKIQFSDLEWIWVDSCCINQDSSAELSEGVNRMFHWYRNATVCIAYLPDVEHSSNVVAFRNSVWFKRGWTLQELLASTVVVFLTRNWQVFGHKGNAAHLRCRTQVGPNIESLLAETTRIPLAILQDFSASHSLTIEERLSWMEGRETLREEDMFYAMFGIFDVAPNAHYGEGSHRARRRLLKAIEDEHASPGRTLHGEEQDTAEVEAWLSPPDASTSHAFAREHHEPGTCAWLIEREQYKRWKAGTIRHLWLHGKPGCGKSVLCSTVIEDLQVHPLDNAKTALVYFYFTFSDNHKQSYDDLLSALIAQVMSKEPARSMLRQLHGMSRRTRPATRELEKVLIQTAATYHEVLIALDALDESSEVSDTRRNLLKRLKKLLSECKKLRLFATSRYLPDILGFMEDLSCEQISIQPRDVSGDIQQYVMTQLSTEPRLRHFRLAAKTKIENHVSHNADGMFRWASLLLEQLAKLKMANRSAIEAALDRFPKDLDDIYSRILQDVEGDCQQDALTLLRWITYARQPLSLGELAEALIIDPQRDTIDFEERSDHYDILWLLSSLVIAIEHDAQEEKPISHAIVTSKTKVRLAHFTVKEFLESTRILDGEVKHFHLESGRGHNFITQCCLTYLKRYTTSKKALAAEDPETLPLLEYAASSWYRHSILHGFQDVTLETQFLTSESALHGWLSIHNPDNPWNTRSYPISSSPLYYASCIGLASVARKLLDMGYAVDALGGTYANALQAASHAGHIKIVELLIARSADINAHDQGQANALQVAAEAGHEDIVGMLLEKGAEMVVDHNNMTALHYTAFTGYEGVAETILASGIPVDLPISRRNWRSSVTKGKVLWSTNESVCQGTVSIKGLTPLHFAVLIGATRMTKYFLDHGADPNAFTNTGETALHIALKEDVNGSDYEDCWKDSHFRVEDALDHVLLGDEDEYHLEVAALARWRLEVLQTILAHPGTDILAKDHQGLTALHCVRYDTCNSIAVVEELLRHGADVTQIDIERKTALLLACAAGDAEATALLLQHGANIEDTDIRGMSALHHASKHGSGKTISLLLDELEPLSLRAYANRKDNLGRSALHHLMQEPLAVERSAVQSLISSGICIDDIDSDGCSPLALWLMQPFVRPEHKAHVADLLFASGANPTYQYCGQNLAHLSARGEIGIELLTSLREYGVDLTSVDDDGRTIVHHLASHGSIEQLEVLSFLRHVVGLSVEDLDLAGRTPLDIAFAKSQEAHPTFMYRPHRWHRTSELLAVSRQ